MKRTLIIGLFFLVGIFFPVLIWVALAVALKQWAHEATQRPRTVGAILQAAGLSVRWVTINDQSPETMLFTKRSITEIRELLNRAGL